MVALVPKSRGGHRPIGIFTAIQRLWAKARMPLVEAWEAQHVRPYIACAKGSGSMDVVWRQAVRAEAGVESGQEACAVLWDLKSFFDSIDHGLLLARAHQLGFPKALVAMALASYVAPRVLQVREGLAPPVYPRRGVLAGCCFAKALVTVYYLPPIDAFISRNPSVSLDIYIDDLTLSSVSGSAPKLEQHIVAAALDLADVVEAELRCTIALSKAAVVASSESLAKVLRSSIGRASGAPVLRAANLGIDFSSGRRRGRLWNGIRGKRIRRCLLRKAKVTSLRRLVGRRIARHVFSAGIAPAAGYGAEVNGVSDREWGVPRRVAGAAIAPCTSGRSLTASMLLLDDPTWRAAVAPAARWQKEIWRATDPRHPHMRAADGRHARFTREQLADAWGKVAANQWQWQGRDGSPK